MYNCHLRYPLSKSHCLAVRIVLRRLKPWGHVLNLPISGSARSPNLQSSQNLVVFTDSSESHANSNSSPEVLKSSSDQRCIATVQATVFEDHNEAKHFRHFQNLVMRINGSRSSKLNALNIKLKTLALAVAASR